MRTFLGFIVCISAFFTGCNRNPGKIGDTAIVYDSISIYNNFPYLSHYWTGGSGTVLKEGKLVMAGYNHYMHTIDFFDITSGKADSALTLEHEGVNGVVPYVAGLALTPSAMVLKRSQFEVIVADYGGKVLNRINVSEIVDPATGFIYLMKPPGISTGNYRSYLSYYPGSSSVFFTVHPSVNADNKDWCKYYVGIEVDIQDGGLKFIPVTYGDLLESDQSSDNYLNLIYPYITDAGEFLIFNSPFRSLVFLYDKRTGKLQSYNPESTFTRNITSFPVDINRVSNVKKTLYELDALQFREVYYSEKLDVFYRVHYGAKEQETNRRERILMIMNREMEVLCEIKLPEFFTDYYFVGDDAIYFYLKNETDDMHLGTVKVVDLF